MRARARAIFYVHLYAASLRTATHRDQRSLLLRNSSLSLRPSKNVGAVEGARRRYVKIFYIIKINKSIARSNTSKTTQLRPCSCYLNKLTQYNF